MKPYYTDSHVTIYHGDCRDVLPSLALKSCCVVITDPPYGVTDHEWDEPVDPLVWMVTDAAVVTASEPFATSLIRSAALTFRYDLVWVKNTVSNAMNAALMPMRAHERVLVFGSPKYFPIKRRRTAEELLRLNREQRKAHEWASPTSVLTFEAVNNRNSDRVGHPSQKPVSLFAWLVRSYGDESLIVDPFMGSGTTLVACHRMDNLAIGIEREERYCEIAARRCEAAAQQDALFVADDGPVSGGEIQEALL